MFRLKTAAYDFGPYRLDPVRRTLWRRGELVALPPKAVEVLTALVKQPGTVLAKHDLMRSVWPDTFVEEANLVQMIFLLRRAIEDRNGGREYIRTVPRRGYRFAGDVRSIEIGRTYRIESIAVLPLANLSGDPSQEYFADGITEALIAHLVKISSLRVVSRTSAMRYKGSKESIAEIAGALRVDALVEGSATRFGGDRVRITVKLIHAATDRHLWAETYDGQVLELLELQGKVARAVATAVRVNLTEDEEARLTDSRQVDPDAYSLYLKGRYFARNLTDEGQRKAIHYFQESIQLDPNYAAPHASMAECFVSLAFYFGMVPKDAFSPAKVAAERAVQLDETFAEGHAVLGLLRLLDEWNWDAAETEFARAVELAPGDAYVHWKRGMYLQYAGRGEEAVAAHRRAEQLDPLSLVAMEEAGWPLYYSRRYDEAAAQFRKVVELAPDWFLGHFGLGLVLIQQQHYEEALGELRCGARLSGSNPYIESALAYACGMAGCRAEASQILDRLTSTHRYVPNWFLSLIWIGMGEREQALQCLQQAFRDREPCMVSLNVDPMFDPLRPDARFSELVHHVESGTIAGMNGLPLRDST